MRLAIGIAVLSASASVALADMVNYSTASRSLQATSGGPAASDATAASGAWAAEVNSYSPTFDAWNPTAPSYYAGAGLASQNSSLDPFGVSATLTARAWDGNLGFGGSASASLVITFTLASPASYTLSGSWAAGDAIVCNPLSSFITLAGAGNSQIFSGGYNAANPGDSSGALNLTGSLAPGAYTLTASVADGVQYVGANLGEKDASMSFSLALVPAPGSAGILALGFFSARRQTRPASPCRHLSPLPLPSSHRSS